jgi:hypothetical protein
LQWFRTGVNTVVEVGEIIAFNAFMSGVTEVLISIVFEAVMSVPLGQSNLVQFTDFEAVLLGA